MVAPVVFVTGSDTGVGKTVFSALLLASLRQQGIAARGVKPFCTGDPGDAELLQSLNADTSIPTNRWFWEQPVAPLLAARAAGKRVMLDEAVAWIERERESCEALVVEGAGGLLSPLGEGFSNRELIRALRAAAAIVVPNRLGAVNQGCLVVEALGNSAMAVVLMGQEVVETELERTNLELLAEHIAIPAIHSLPHLGPSASTREVVEHQARALAAPLLEISRALLMRPV